MFRLLSTKCAPFCAAGLQGGSQRRHAHQISFRSSSVLSTADQEEKDVDSDEGSVMAEGAAARKLRRER